MKNFLKSIRKNWITVWLIAVFLLSSVFVVYAAYRKVTSVKRVVTTQSSPQILFSSNCMLDYEYGKKIPSEQFTVTVCNYDQSDKDTANANEIAYRFTAQLLYKLGDSYIPLNELGEKVNAGEVNITAEEYAEYVKDAKNYAIQPTQNDNEENNAGIKFYYYNNQEQEIEIVPDDDGKIKFWDKPDYKIFTSQTLPGRVSSTDKFLITIPRDDLDDPDPKFYILVKAEPQGDSSLNPISARLYGAKNIVITASWDGDLVEGNTNDTDYDFYNYVITGSGSGKLDIMWNPDWFYVSDFFFQTELSGVNFYDTSTPATITDDSSDYYGWNKVTIEVNSSDVTDDQNNTTAGRSRYELQLYKVKPNTPYTGNNDASNFIACKLQSETPDEP